MLTCVACDVIVTSYRRRDDITGEAQEVAPMGRGIREELGWLRVNDLLREADERSKRRSTGRSTRRPLPRTGREG